MSMLEIIKLRHGLVLAGLLLNSSLSFADKVSGLVYEDGSCQGLSNAVVRFTPPKGSGKSIVATVTDGSGVFTADLPTNEEYYLDISVGTQQIYGRVVQVTSDHPLWISLQSSQGTNQNPVSANQLFCQLTASRKSAIGQPLIINGTVLCGPTGDSSRGRNTELDQNKNRADQPLFYVPLSWDDLKNLPSDHWNDFQGAPVSVEGYLSHKIVVQNRGGESANCHLLGDKEVDWHLYLAKSPHQEPKEAIVVETTPRVRPAHKWTPKMLTQYVGSETKVRISGWLMYDFQHTAWVGRFSASAWEIHPITRIEAQRNDRWVDLDSGQ